MAACPDEANQFFEYMTNSAAGSLERGADLQIMFGVGGERDLTERELPRLTGWRSSAPVRVGNGAWSQRQLDVYGELLNAVFRMSDHLRPGIPAGWALAGPDKWGAPPDLTPATKRFLVDLADAAASHWQDKDQGIRRFRSEPRDFLYSKVMCWVALDRAVALAVPLGATERSGCMETHPEPDTRDRRRPKAGAIVPRPLPSPSALTTSTPPTCCCRGRFPTRGRPQGAVHHRRDRTTSH